VKTPRSSFPVLIFGTMVLISTAITSRSKVRPEASCSDTEFSPFSQYPNPCCSLDPPVDLNSGSVGGEGG
jgi:hypothetical protein